MNKCHSVYLEIIEAAPCWWLDEGQNPPQNSKSSGTVLSVAGGAAIVGIGLCFLFGGSKLANSISRYRQHKQEQDKIRERAYRKALRDI